MIKYYNQISWGGQSSGAEFKLFKTLKTDDISYTKYYSSHCNTWL